MKRILCFGDSNTYGYDPRSYFGGRYDAGSRWVDLLAQASGWEVQNAGENGREIPRREGELLRFQQLLADAQPVDLLLVMLGSNDLLQGVEAAQVAARMEDFLEKVPLPREKVVLIAPPPMKWGAWVTEDRLPEDSLRLIAAFRALSQRLGTRFVDTERWEIDLTFDGVHFSEQGHRAFAQRLSLILRKLADSHK